MNRTILVGRLVRDPELKQTPGGKDYCRFTIAVDRKIKKGEEKQADFISCTAWGKTAEFVSKYFAKGKLIGLSGSIRTGSYERNGQKVYTTEVWADDVEFVGSKSDNPAPTASPGAGMPGPADEPPLPDDDFEMLNDAELPF